VSLIYRAGGQGGSVGNVGRGQSADTQKLNRLTVGRALRIVQGTTTEGSGWHVSFPDRLPAADR